MPTSIEPNSVPSRRASPTLSLLGVILLAVACSSVEPLPAAEYFPMVEAELMRLDQSTRDLTDRYATELETEMSRILDAVDPEDETASNRMLADILAVAKVKMQAIVSSHAGQLEVFAERVGALEPPAAVRSAHDELVAAFAGWAATGESTTLALSAAEELAALPGIISGSSYADAQLRVDAACRALEGNAAAVDVALTCPGTRLGVLAVTP